MSTEAHKAIIRRFVEEVQNGDYLVAADELAPPTARSSRAGTWVTTSACCTSSATVQSPTR